MKEGRSLQELAIELERQRGATRDYKAPSRLLHYSHDHQLTMGHPGEQVQVKTNSLFVSQLREWTGIPQKYWDRMVVEDTQLLAFNVNRWMQHKNETRLVRTLDGTARAFLSHRYRIIDNIDVVEAVLPVFHERGITSVSQEVTSDRLYLKAVNDRKTIDLKRGDKVQFGVVISNSEVGLGAVHVDPLVYTLACLNGAIIADAGLRKFHIGRRLAELDESSQVFKDDTVKADDKAFFLKLRDVVNAAFDETQMTDVIESIDAGTQRRLGEGKTLDAVVEVTANKYGLNQLEADGVLRQLIEGRDLTQWGLSSAVTNFSQRVTSYERATDLEKIGGELATMSEEEWQELAA